MKLIHLPRTDRHEVYDVINGERDYQDNMWNKDTTTTEGLHPPIEFVVIIQEYVNRALNAWTTTGEPAGSQEVLHNLRKIAALAVAAMEQNGAPNRPGY